jgi:hypothetical protein
MRSIVRRDNGASYEEFLTGLARQSGIETPTREELARIDRNRKKKTSNQEWVSPSDPDARVAKMKDGSTHLAHKAEHAVDMTSGTVIAVTLQAADEGDTTTIQETLAETAGNLAHLIERKAKKTAAEEPRVSLDPLVYPANFCHFFIQLEAKSELSRLQKFFPLSEASNRCASPTSTPNLPPQKYWGLSHGQLADSS